ncbi:LCP family protein [Lactobacillus sp. ESL0791]|uniref:LCP family glycopolymer transferase n=1 Tax=Lactobacillus sp. ESL0791 TaxID=2983234 RepID=UPI0023F86F8F|nr:LCP family protein [Lactobacillus sp. ESL0791]MDF7638048.1 LCP family protein [Lactobacillus sp. ESL0791]
MKNNDNHPGKSRVELHAKDYRVKHRVLIRILAVLVALVTATAVYSAYIYFKTKKTADSVYDNNNRVEIRDGEFNGKNKFAVLLMGTDTGAFDRKEKIGNTDTIILTAVNPQKKRYTLMSVPRDTMAQMVGTKNFQAEKINAAYPIGGAKMAMTSVSKLLAVPVKYYAIVNMEGIMKIIHYVGGIDIRPTLTFAYGGYSFQKGQLTHMSGASALAYSRMRYDDPDGDYGRQARQRQVITTLVEKTISLNSLSKIDAILEAIAGNVKTNLTFDALRQIVLNYRGCARTVKNDYLHGSNVTIDGSAYQVQSTTELQRVSDYLRGELGLKKQLLNNNETYQNQRNIANGFSFKNPTAQNYNIYDDYVEEGDN